jgi:hypothetical protein
LRFSDADWYNSRVGFNLKVASWLNLTHDSQFPIFDSELRKTFAFYVDANSNYVSILITSDPPPNPAASRGKGASVESDLKFVRYLKTNAKFRIRLTLLLPRRPPLVSDGFFFRPL